MRVEKGSAAHDLLGIWAIGCAYAPIALALISFALWRNPWIYVLSFIVIGARMHAISILAHDTYHRTLFRSRRVNDVLGMYLFSFPLGMRFLSMREKHLEHHRLVGTIDDPDRYYWDWSTEERARFIVQMLLSATGARYILWVTRTLLGRPPSSVPSRRPAAPIFKSSSRNPAELIKLVLVQCVLLGGFAVSLGWVWYFALWIFPLISLAFLLGELRQFLEHARGGQLMVFRAGSVERFFLGSFNFHLHGFHHAFASEPWFRIPEIEKVALKKEPGIVLAGSYFQELMRYLRGLPYSAFSPKQANAS